MRVALVIRKAGTQQAVLQRIDPGAANPFPVKVGAFAALRREQLVEHGL